MDYKIVFFLALLVASSACYPAETPSCACGRIYAPVCASDWVTSNNNCEFLCRADFMKRKFGKEIRVVKTGRCEDSHHY